MAALTVLERKRVEKIYDITLPWYLRSAPLDGSRDQTWYIKVEENDEGGVRLTTLIVHHYGKGYEIKIENIGMEPLDELKLGRDTGNYSPEGMPEEMFHKTLDTIREKIKDIY